MKRGYWVNVAKENGINPNTFYQRKKNGMSEEEAATKRIVRNEYAVYKGDDLIVVGTARECAEFMNVTPKYIRWMTSPAARKKASRWKNPTIAIKLEDD